MSGVPTGRTSRLASDLSVGLIKSINDRNVQKQLEGLQEFEEQFQIEISGRAEEFPVWTTAQLAFSINYVDATGQRDTPFDRPHFTYGAFIESTDPIGILACVTSWITNDRNETRGCELAIGAVATDLSKKFRGQLHATFQGYGAPLDVFGDTGLSIDIP